MFETLNLSFLLTLAVNTLSVTLLVCCGYLRLFSSAASTEQTVANREYAMSFLVFSIGVFIVTFLLHSVEISMGFAFGLFAVFSMLRYRTETISVKEMTYLFLVIGMSLLSAVGPLNLLELSCLHLIIIISTVICEKLLSAPALLTQQIQYENIEHIKPQNRQLLLEELQKRTGLNIQEVKLMQIDFVRDIAHLEIFYLPIFNTAEKAKND